MAKDANKPENPGNPGKPKGGGSSKGGGGGGKHKDADVPPEALLKAPARLKAKFDQEVRAKVAEKFGITNPMAQPRLQKIVLNVNMGRHLEGTKLPPDVRSTVVETLTKVSGQKPVVIKAKKSVSNFKVRAGFE